jgi:hypothetical protein
MNYNLKLLCLDYIVFYLHLYNISLLSKNI